MIPQSTPAGPPTFSLKAPRQPMLWAALAYTAGLVIGAREWRPGAWWVAASIVFILSGAFFARRRVRMGWIVALGAFFLAGAFQIQARLACPRLDTGVQAFADRQPIQVVAHVIKEGRLRDKGSEIRQIVDVESEQVRTDAGLSAPVQSHIRLGIYSSRISEGSTANANSDGNGTIRIFQYGERIRLTARLRRPRNFRNPGAFDYEGYLADRGISALGSAKLDDVEVLSGFTGSRVQLWRTNLHSSILAKVHALWTPRDAALIDAMIIGEDAFIDRDTRTDFQRSGTYHVLVVSGMNVSILALAVFWTLRRFRLSDIFCTLLTIALCVAYAFITDVGAPVWRATLMCSVYLLTRLLYRDRAMLNGIGTAALVLLIYDPRQIFTASFQMTFACVLIVAGIGIPILQRTSQLYKAGMRNWKSIDYASQLPPKVAQFRVDLQLVASRLARFVGENWSRRIVCVSVASVFAAWELVFISAVMQMSLALPMAYYFHRATTVGLPANLLVVPLTQLMMPAAITALTLGYVWPAAAKIPAVLTTLAVHGITGTVRGLGSLQMADMRVPLPSMMLVVISAAALLLAMWGARRHRAVAMAGIGSILVASLALALLSPSPRTRRGILELTSIDVGEGDSNLLVTPEGKTLLIDAGGPIGPAASQLDFGEDVVSPYLWSRGISRLDAVAITHAHYDHIGGVVAVLKNFRPKELWVGLLPPSRILEDVLGTARALNIPVVQRWQGDEFQFGGANFKVLYPPSKAAVADRPRNNDSMVLHASYGQTSVLLEGDAEKTVERRIAATHCPQATLLKVGHHGSTNATTPELVNSVRPRFAVISVGAFNPFGLPRMETLSRLAESGASVYRTDLDGAVTFYLDGRSVTTSVAVLR
jgi:competence protein ComEC